MPVLRLFLLVLTTLLGCGDPGAEAESGEDPETSGEPSSEPDPPPPGACNGCDEVVTILDGTSPGATVIDPSRVLAAEGGYAGTLEWGTPGNPSLVEARTTALTLEVENGDGATRDVVSRLHPGCSVDGPSPCCSRVEHDATLRFTAEEGSLAESWPVVLEYIPGSLDQCGISPATAPSGTTRVEFEFGFEDLMGDLSAEDFDFPEWTARSVTLELGIVDGTATGSLHVHIVSGWGAEETRRVATFTASPTQ